MTRTDTSIAPSSGSERIVALDALRGFALLGILLVNVLSFSGIFALGTDDPSTIDQAVQRFIQIFAQGKFRSLFSLLFGVGFWLQLSRLESKGLGAFPTYWRRLAILFLFGMLHTLLDPGEVLGLYALCGALLMIFYRADWRAVLVAAPLLLALPQLQTAVSTVMAITEASVATSPEAPEASARAEDAVDVGTGSEEEGDRPSWDFYGSPEVSRVLSGGSFAEVVAMNFAFTVNRWTESWVSYLWLTVPLPMMLIGLLVGRSGVLNRIEQSRRLLQMVLWIGLAVGLGLYASMWILNRWAAAAAWNPWIGFAANMLFVSSASILPLAYGAGLFLLFRNATARRLLLPLCPVGRTALSNYLLQTVVCVNLFYGFGLGLYGTLGASEAVIVALVIFAAQSWLSAVWLRHFQFGPLEWLWRCATYWQILPLRIRKHEGTDAARAA